MALLGLSRRSLRDISGNLVPLGVLLFFAGWFVIERPLGWGPFSIAIVYGLLVALAGLLFLVTYAFARVFQAEESVE